jgi:putative transposase
VKFGFVAKHRGTWPVALMCGTLGVSRGGFYAWLRRPRSQRERRDQALDKLIKRSFADSDRTYGARRVWRDVLAAGMDCGLHRVERLMREAALRARPRRRGLPKDEGSRSEIADNVLDRQFTAEAPNQKWVADFTYVSTWQGFVYVAFVVDVFARRIVGWRVSSSMQTDFVLDALEQALYARRAERGGELVHHSDRGSQHVSIRYSERLAEADIESSVGSTGDSYENAPAETINGLFKAEVIHRRGPWQTGEAVELATLEWVSWFNHHRLLESIGYIPPAEAEANYWRQQAQASAINRPAASAAPQEG